VGCQIERSGPEGKGAGPKREEGDGPPGEREGREDDGLGRARPREEEGLGVFSLKLIFPFFENWFETNFENQTEPGLILNLKVFEISFIYYIVLGV
jgi:hypothetical protein